MWGRPHVPRYRIRVVPACPPNADSLWTIRTGKLAELRQCAKEERSNGNLVECIQYCEACHAGSDGSSNSRWEESENHCLLDHDGLRSHADRGRRCDAGGAIPG